MSKKVESVKSSRLEIRIQPELKSRLNELADSLNLSRNQLIENQLWSIVLTPKQYFICCPDCSAPMFDGSMISVMGIMQTECNNGHEHLFDSSTNEFVTREQAIINATNDDRIDFALSMIDKSFFKSERLELEKWRDLNNLLSPNYRLLSESEAVEYASFLSVFKYKIIEKYGN